MSLCGEMAADPRYALLLIGLGLRRLSMSPRQIPEVKSWIRELTVSGLGELATRCLEHGTAAEVQKQLDGYIGCLRPA